MWTKSKDQQWYCQILKYLLTIYISISFNFEQTVEKDDRNITPPPTPLFIQVVLMSVIPDSSQDVDLIKLLYILGVISQKIQNIYIFYLPCEERRY